MMRYRKWILTIEICMCLAVPGGMYSLHAEVAEEIYPIKLSYPENFPDGFETTGQWKRTDRSVTSSGTGTETMVPRSYSALKSIELQASFEMTASSPRGGAGLQIGFSRAKSVRWTYMYYPDEKEIRLEFRNGASSRILRSYHRALNSPYTLKAELKSDGSIKLWANGELIESGNGVLGGIPVFFNSGIVTTDAAATFSEWTVQGGDYVRPAIALGDSITHHCRWQRPVGRISGVEITNGGMAGESSAFARRRFDSDVAALRPRLVFIFTGTNDSNSADAAENVKAIAEAAQKAGIRPVICTLLPREGLPRIGEFNRNIRLYAEANRIALVDWNSLLDDGSGKMRPELGDKVHPNAKGTELMADFLCNQEMIRELLSGLKPEPGASSSHSTK